MNCGVIYISVVAIPVKELVFKMDGVMLIKRRKETCKNYTTQNINKTVQIYVHISESRARCVASIVFAPVRDQDVVSSTFRHNSF